ncbi:MAG TPA: hypothetical protein PLF63_15680, partial [Rubrivivax sp.]|nr:hypothetical protein [Rubrivivax sp.]
MPWPFGPDKDGTNSGEGGNAADAAGGGLNRHGRRLKWRSQRQKAQEKRGTAQARSAKRAGLIHDGLDVSPVGTVLASSTSGPADFVADNGTKVTATLSGPGQWQFVQGAALPTLIITGTDASSNFSITGAGGTGRVLLEGVSVAGAIGTFSAPSTDPVSSFSLGGGAQTIVLGNVRDMVLTASAAIGSLSVAGWATTGPVANGLVAPSLDA